MRVGTFPFGVLGRAKMAGETDGFVKIVAEKKYDELLGVQIVRKALDELMAKSRHDRKEDFLPVLTNTACEGKTYGIPFNRSVPILYWNRDRFQKAGIAGPPKTWAELAAIAPKLTQEGAGGPGAKVFGFMPINQWWFFQAMCVSTSFTCAASTPYRLEYAGISRLNSAGAVRVVLVPSPGGRA